MILARQLMNWLNIETATLDSEAFVGSEPTSRGTWLCLLRFCAGQENGGVIKDASSWADRKWQQLARVTQAEVKADSALWSWVGNDLVLWAYPIEKESEVREKRERARTNGKLGGRPPLVPPSTATDTNVGSQEKPTLVNSAKAEGNGREGKEKGKEDGSGVVTPPPALSSDQTEKPQKQPKQTDAEWLAELATSPAYRGIDVPREHAKALVWASANKKTMSRRRFINWVNRCETAMAPQAGRTCDSTPSIAEPNGWRAWVNDNAPDSVYARGGAQEGAQWSALDRATQEWLTKQTARAEQFQHRK